MSIFKTALEELNPVVIEETPDETEFIISQSPVNDYNISKLNEAIDGVDDLEAVNDILIKNEDSFDEIPAHSQETITLAIESIRERLLGRKIQSTGLESFRNKKQLRLAIEDNRNIIQKVWDAIIGFFKKIYEFIAGLLGFSKSKSSSNEAKLNKATSAASKLPDVNKMKEMVTVVNKAGEKIQEDHLKKLKERNDKNLADLEKAREEVRELKSFKQTLEAENRKKEMEERRKKAHEIKGAELERNIKKHEDDLVRISKELDSLTFYDCVFTNKYNKYINRAVVKDTKKVISLNLDDDIKEFTGGLERGSGILMDGIRKANTHLFLIKRILKDSYSEALMNDINADEHDVYSKKLRSTMGKNKAHFVNSHKEIVESIEDTINRFKVDTRTVFDFVFDDGVPVIAEELTFEITIKKKSRDLVREAQSKFKNSFSSIERVNEEAKKLNDRVEDFVKTLEEFKKAYKPKNDKDKAGYDEEFKVFNEGIQNIMKGVGSLISFTAKVLSQANGLTDCYISLTGGIVARTIDEYIEFEKIAKEILDAKKVELEVEKIQLAKHKNNK